MTTMRARNWRMQFEYYATAMLVAVGLLLLGYTVIFGIMHWLNINNVAGYYDALTLPMALISLIVPAISYYNGFHLSIGMSNTRSVFLTNWLMITLLLSLGLALINGLSGVGWTWAANRMAGQQASFELSLQAIGLNSLTYLAFSLFGASVFSVSKTNNRWYKWLMALGIIIGIAGSELTREYIEVYFHYGDAPASRIIIQAIVIGGFGLITLLSTYHKLELSSEL